MVSENIGRSVGGAVIDLVPSATAALGIVALPTMAVNAEASAVAKLIRILRTEKGSPSRWIRLWKR